ncbi:hypothetical protein ACLMLE_07660 [Lysobacter capsici]
MDSPAASDDKVYPHADLPTVWRDRVHRDGDAEANDAPSESDDDDDLRASARSNRSGRPGEKSTSKLQSLVELWLDGYPEIRNRRLRMANSTAQTWGEMFQSVDSNAARDAADRRVWFGYLSNVNIYGGQGISLIINDPQGRKPYITPYLRFNETARSRQPELWRLLNLVKKRDTIQAFLLGMRNADSREITLEAPHYFWVVDRSVRR